MLIFQHSSPKRQAHAQIPTDAKPLSGIPAALQRQTTPLLPAVSELQTVRHYTNLSRKNFAIDTHFYPLGSCTMKYNPRGVHRIAMLPDFLARHPLADLSHSQGYLHCAYELQTLLAEVTGMHGVSLAPMAGAQGEFAGIAMIKAYHEAKGDQRRCEIIVPDAAHGTNPATAVMCGYRVKEIPTRADGDVDLDALRASIGEQTAGIMLTNPSTVGVFDRDIEKIATMIHQVGGLLYYDGANLNAILGECRPGDMGFDVMHMNLHKTFATPHGGGGPGCGPVAFNARLAPFAPIPMVAKNDNGYYWRDETELPDSIGRLSCFMGNAGIILRAYFYLRILGRAGLPRVGEFATLNANYLQSRLAAAGFRLAYPKRRASHEFIISFKQEATQDGVNAMAIAKRLLDYGFHAPTTYFPLVVPECFLIEPTETETQEEMDAFIAALIAIREEIKTDPDTVRNAPHTLPVKRLDDVKAARELDIVFTP